MDGLYTQAWITSALSASDVIMHVCGSGDVIWRVIGAVSLLTNDVFVTLLGYWYTFLPYYISICCIFASDTSHPMGGLMSVAGGQKSVCPKGNKTHLLWGMVLSSVWSWEQILTGS